MSFVPNDPWYVCLPPCETRLPCGQGLHTVRWEAGTLRLPGHGDPEAELVLAALGGEKARCVEVAESWGRHASDLTVLAIGPRGPADKIVVGWDDVDAAAQAGPHTGWAGYAQLAGPPGHGPMRVASPLPAAVRAGLRARYQQTQQSLEQARQRRSDMLSLLALGHAFQVRLAGQVAAAHAGRLDADGEPSGVRPVLTAALAGRLGPAVEAWLGLDPEQLAVSLHEGPGWGSAELTGRGEQRRLRISLPTGWLARVWACGLALVGPHLVVAVERGGWPQARVLALRAPGAEPVRLDVHAREDRGAGPAGAPDGSHWNLQAPPGGGPEAAGDTA